MNMVQAIDQQRRENLGPAERLIQALLTYTDHCYHGRPGAVKADARQATGFIWEPVTHKEENGVKTVYRLVKQGKKTVKTAIGTLEADGSIRKDGVKVAEYRAPGLFPEVVAWVYRQVAEVWKLDNEFAARWASFAFAQEHRDLKTVLAAFMLVQSRKGDPIIEDGKVLFSDEDYRDVGEAMFLIYNKQGNGRMDPKHLLRARAVLQLPQVAEINRELGFGNSARTPFLGRWGKVVHRWLAYREDNPQLLAGLVKAGYRQTVMELARTSGYKPSTPKFFETLRWKQAQSKDGRRSLAIGQEVAAAETWTGLTEAQICEKIMAERVGFKRIIGLVPNGLTRAIMAAAVEAGSLSNKDLIIQSPTLEELGLLEDPTVKPRWEAALRLAEDQRAANIASRMQTKAAQEKLQDAADTSVKKAVEEVVKNLRIYFMIDISSSMQGAIDQAKAYLETFLQGFPADKIHISVFNTVGREVKLQHHSRAGVAQAFRGITASGGTRYEAGFEALRQYRPTAEEDTLFFYIGDEDASSFEGAVRNSGLNPMAIAFVPVVSGHWGGRGQACRSTAANLGIPLIEVDTNTFADAYAIPRTLRNLIASTPVSQNRAFNTPAVARLTLVDQVLQTELLKKPVWAATA